MGWRIGIDTGGTFTDVIAIDDATHEQRVAKIWSTPEDVAGSIKQAMQSIGLVAGDIESITYGTTAITNAIVEGKLARTAFVTTAGFKDVLRIARQKRDFPYDLKAPHRAPPPVLDTDCFEVDERCSHQGEIVRHAAADSLAGLLDEIPADCEAVAVAFLHAYANGANEAAAAAILRQRFDHISLSHEVSPEAREYERSITTVLNAALLPLIRRIVTSLQRLPAASGRLRFFHSAGGLTSPALAVKYPLTLAMSGPAAGAQAASAVARELAIPYAVGFDMGGTTTDCSLIVDGQASLAPETKIGAMLIRQPAISVQSIGAGGGSVVRYANGHLTVGPESAGAVPGPACYLKGGTLPTLTDAAAILGMFGDIAASSRPVQVDSAAARRCFEPLARELGATVEDLALGTIGVAAALASRAIKAVTMNCGIDARSCALIAFGGAGPMFAPFVAQEIGLQTIIVPDQSSGLSAVGCLSADPSITRQWTIRLGMADATAQRVGTIATQLLQALHEEFGGAGGSGHGAAATETLVGLLRYPGQSYEIEVPFALPFDPVRMTAAFEDLHRQAYGFATGDPWEFVAMRVTVATPRATSPARVRTIETRLPDLPPTRCCFDRSGWTETQQYRRDALHKSVAGPAIILDDVSTIVVPPGFAASPDGAHLRLHRTAAAAARVQAISSGLLEDADACA